MLAYRYLRRWRVCRCLSLRWLVRLLDWLDAFLAWRNKVVEISNLLRLLAVCGLYRLTH